VHPRSFDLRFVSGHLFHSLPKRVTSYRKDQVAELIIMLGGGYQAWQSTSSGRPFLSARAGDVVFWPPGVARVEENVAGESIHCIALYFNWRSPVSLPQPVSVHDRNRIITLLAERLLALKALPLPLPMSIHNSYLAGIMAEFLHLLATHEDALVNQTARYVDAHMDEPFSLRTLAKEMRLERHHFGRRFKAVTGMTPMTYVRRRKAEHAFNALLINPRRTPEEVASRIGVHNKHQVRRLLKKHYGITLRDIARHHRAAPRRRGSEPATHPEWVYAPIPAWTPHPKK
jgi:AraC-like DNA-binding protein